MSSSFNKGFTLVEMLIVVSIVVIISTVVMINFPQYSAHQQLQLAAQDVLTTIRETQLYGIAVRGETVGSQTIYKSQGIYINIDDGFAPNQTIPVPLWPQVGTYFMAYIDADHVIGSPSSLAEGFNQESCLVNSLEGPCVVKELDEPIRITRLCVSYDDDTELCSDDADPITAIDILFQRPEPEPKIWAFDADGRITSLGPVKSAKISLEAIADNDISINAGTKTVWIHNTGQVSVIGEESKVASGGGTLCPLVYSWNGTDFVFEHKAQSLPIAFEHTTFNSLFYVDDSSGELKIRIVEPRDTTFINKYNVFAVDYPLTYGKDARVLPDSQGDVYLIKNPQSPQSCKTGTENTDCLNLVSYEDGRYMQLGPGDGKENETSIQVSIPTSEVDAEGRIYIQFHTNSVLDEILASLQDRLLPGVASSWNNSLHNSLLRNINGLSQLEEAMALKVSIFEGGEWKEVGRKYPSFRSYPEHLVIPIKEENSLGDIQIKIESNGWYLIDHVAVDWGKESPLTKTELVAKQVQSDGEDVDVKIKVSDEEYLVLSKGKMADFVYKVPPLAENEQRTYISEFGGHYLVGEGQGALSFEGIKETTKIFYYLFNQGAMQDGLRGYGTAPL